MKSTANSPIFAPFGIAMDGVWWPTVEHYFQAHKFNDRNYQERIRTAQTPKQASELGRSRQFPLINNWDEVKVQIMHKAVLQKFLTHEPLKQMLLKTGDSEIVENAPGDYFWGCGKEGTGLNHLGKILQVVREELRDYQK